jgi:hypothetical protein
MGLKLNLPVLLLLVAACGSGMPQVDAGETSDAGEAPDAGKIADAGMTSDSGAPDSGTPDAGPSGLPLLGNGKHTLDSISYSLVAGPADGLNRPRDIAVNPASPNDVWIVNYADSSMVIVKGLGTPQETKLKKMGFGNVHFMPRPSALAFGQTNRMATAHEEDRATQSSTPADFMGPSLWPTDATFEAGHLSHMDMLHNSPNAVGIAWDRANIYWVFDGYHKSITRYDFANDHGPGGDDHSDGVITRCAEGQVGYFSGVSSGMELDQTTKLLYIADSGNRRIAVMNTMNTGAMTPINPNYDGATQNLMAGMTVTTLISSTTSPLRRPSGLALRDGILYVGDNETSKIYAFDLTGKLLDWVDLSAIVNTGGLMGLDVDAKGNLFTVDALQNRAIRITAKL